MKTITTTQLLAAAVIVAFVSFSPSTTLAQVVLKDGTCPAGYKISGQYCVVKKGSGTAGAVEKNGTCPSGYKTNGNYCVPKSDRVGARHAVQKDGRCPAGYLVQGSYCVERD